MNNVITFGQPMFMNRDEECAYLRRELARVQKIFDDIAATPFNCATVLEVSGKKATIILGNQLLEVVNPPRLELKPGHRVHVDGKTNAVLDVVDDPWVTGQVREVVAVLDARHVEISNGMTGSGTTVVLYAGGVENKEPRAGDRVVLDPSGMIVGRNLGQAKPPRGPGIDTGVSWDDIGGLEEAKRDLRHAIESPVLDKELHARYGKKRPRGVLLCGPAGNGKTLLARAAATAISALHGRETTASGYIYAKGPELLAGLVGASEAGVRALFARARTHFAEHRYPAILVLDEADALLGRRGAGRFEGMERTIVPMFLAEMDGLDDSGAFVMVLTNRADMIDPAILRDGRLDMKVRVARPTKPEAENILSKHLRGRPLEKLSPEKAAAVGAEQLFHERHALYMVRTQSGKDKRFALGDVASGAMCAGLVERATDLAMRREKEAMKETGISAADLREASDRMCAEQKMLEHPQDVADFVEPFKDDVRAIDKVKP